MRFKAKWLPHHLLFFSLCLVYLWLVVEPNLIYHGFGTILPDAPLFATGRAFLMNRLTLPGGGIAYASGLLSQGYFYAWLGAVIIVLVALRLAELFRRHLALAGLPRSALLTGLPAVAFFLIYSQYKHPLSIGLTVTLALALSLAFERVAFRCLSARLGGYGLLAALAFWIGGFGTLLLFAILTTIYSVFLRKDRAMAVLIPPASIALAWALTDYVFLIAPNQAFLILTPLDRSLTSGMDTFLMVLVFVLYGFIPLAVLLAFAWTRRFGRPSLGTRPKATKKSGTKKGRGPSLALLRRTASSAVPVLVMALGLYVSYDELAKPYMLSNYYSRQKQWDRVLQLGQGLPLGRNNIYVNHDIVRALYHTGRLPYDMFRFPQNPQALLLTHEEHPSDLTQLKLADIFVELGHVNMAEKLASELIATKDHLGVAIEKMAWINIVKGHPHTARVYLNTLQRDPVRHRTARSLLGDLEQGFTADQTASIATLRSQMRKKSDALTGNEPIEQTLTALLERNPRNRMAFEYLMACYLLTGQVDKIVDHIDRIDDLGYQVVPPLYEEAILIYYGAQRQKPDLGRFKISPSTIQRYQRFVQIRGAMGPQNRQATLNLLIREFGASYFFYFAFGQVGQV